VLTDEQFLAYLKAERGQEANERIVAANGVLVAIAQAFGSKHAMERFAEALQRGTDAEPAADDFGAQYRARVRAMLEGDE
jgi:hypothetical protein